MIQSLALSLLALTPAGDLVPEDSSFTYTYADLTYVQTDIEGVGPHLEGFSFDGSYEIGWDLRLRAGYSDATLDLPGVNADLSQLEVGVGYYNTANEATDVVLDFSYVSADSGSVTNDGFRAGVLFRFQVYEDFEFNAGISRLDISGGKGTNFGFAGIYSVTDSLGVVAGYDLLDDDETFSLGVRLHAAPGTRMF